MNKGKLAVYGVVLLIVAAALGVRYWSDTHLPPVHPLKVTIVEQGIPKQPLRNVNGDYFAPGELRATDNMRQLAQGREIEGGDTTWELLDVQQRRSPGASWAAPQLPKDKKPRPLPFKFTFNQDKIPYANLNYIASHAGEWKITVRASRRYYDPNSKEEWVGSAQYVLTRTLKEDWAAVRRAKEIAFRAARGLPAPTALPPPGAHPLDHEKDYIAGIQWSADNGTTWRDMPQKGLPGFPLTVTADAVTGFRAVKKDPRAPWPDWTSDYENEGEELNSILGWGGDAAPGGHIGESVWLDFSEPNQVAVDENNLLTLTVTCSNTLKRQLRVVPAVEIELEIGTLEMIMQQPQVRRAQLVASAVWQGTGWHPPTRFRFSAEKVKYQALPLKKAQRHPDMQRLATPLGEINKPGAADDVVRAGADGKAQAVLKVPSGAGKLEVRAILLSSDGSELSSETLPLEVP